METLLTIPIITAFVGALRLAGLPSNFAPLASIIVALGFAALSIDGPWQQEVTIAIVLGLAASGLYSGGKVMLVK